MKNVIRWIARRLVRWSYRRLVRWSYRGQAVDLQVGRDEGRVILRISDLIDAAMSPTEACQMAEALRYGATVAAAGEIVSAFAVQAKRPSLEPSLN